MTDPERSGNDEVGSSTGATQPQRPSLTVAVDDLFVPSFASPVVPLQPVGLSMLRLVTPHEGGESNSVLERDARRISMFCTAPALESKELIAELKVEIEMFAYQHGATLHDAAATPRSGAKAAGGLRTCVPPPSEILQLLDPLSREQLMDATMELYGMVHRLYLFAEAAEISAGENPPLGSSVSTRGTPSSLPSAASMRQALMGASVSSARDRKPVVQVERQGGGDPEEQINNYSVVAELGRGAQGRVLLVLNERSEPFAIKVLSRPQPKRLIGLQRQHLQQAQALARGLQTPTNAAAAPIAPLAAISVSAEHSDVGGRLGSLQSTPGSTPSNMSAGRGRAPSTPEVGFIGRGFPQGPPDFAAREIAIMKKLHHRNIVQLHEVIEDADEATTYLVMQYIDNGPVSTLLRDGSWSTVFPPLAMKYMRDIASGLGYLHRHGVVHRDIKPDNILVDRNNVAYLADFGISILMQKSGRAPSVSTAFLGAMMSPSSSTHQPSLGASRSHSNTFSLSCCTTTVAGGPVGTIPFMSPELILATGATPPFSPASDVWALGVTLFVMLYGRLPFLGADVREIMHNIAHGALEFPSTASSEERELFERLLAKDPAKRLTLVEFRRHSMVREAESTGDVPGSPKFEEFKDGASRGFASELVEVSTKDIEEAFARRKMGLRRAGVLQSVLHPHAQTIVSRFAKKIRDRVATARANNPQRRTSHFRSRVLSIIPGQPLTLSPQPPPFPRNGTDASFGDTVSSADAMCDDAVEAELRARNDAAKKKTLPPRRRG